MGEPSPRFRARQRAHRGRRAAFAAVEPSVLQVSSRPARRAV